MMTDLKLLFGHAWRKDKHDVEVYTGFNYNVTGITPPILTNEQLPLALIHWAQKGVTIYIGNPGNSLKQAQKCGGVIPVTL